MCTVSWIHDKDGYQLLCNRDEKLTRKPALEPRLAVRKRYPVSCSRRRGLRGNMDRYE